MPFTSKEQAQMLAQAQTFRLAWEPTQRGRRGEKRAVLVERCVQWGDYQLKVLTADALVYDVALTDHEISGLIVLRYTGEKLWHLVVQQEIGGRHMAP